MTGNLGVGTTAPTQKLDVVGTAQMTGFKMATGASASKVLTSDASGVGTWQTATGGGLPSGTSGQTLRHDGTNWIANSNILNDDTNLTLGRASVNPFIYLKGGTTTHTLAYVHTDGSIYTYLGVPGGAWTFKAGHNVAGADIFRWANSDWVDAMKIYGDSRVYFGNQIGIGTATMTAGTGLTIDKGVTNNTALQLTSSGPGWGSGIKMSNTATGGREFGMYVDSGNPSKLHIADNTAAADRFVIDSVGRVGIGTNVPDSLLHVKSTGVDAFLKVEASGSGKHAYLVLRNSNPTEAYILNNAVNNELEFVAPSHSITFFTNNWANSPLTLVDNKVGLGIVPVNQLHVYSGSSDCFAKIEGGSTHTGNLVLRSNGTESTLTNNQYGNLGINGNNVIIFSTGASNYRGKIDNTGFWAIGGNVPTPTSQLHVKGSVGYNQFRMEQTYTPTSSSDGNGAVGDVAWDTNYVYIKTSSGWKRSALSTF
ncbi:MAG: hypothetical protein PHF95_01620 [bacterium]|nr:hypothetical protein [bacterium]